MAGNQNMSSLQQYIDEASRLLQSGRNGEAVSILTVCVDTVIPQDRAYRAAVGLLQEYALWNESLKFLDGAFQLNQGDHQLWFLRGNALDALNPDPPSMEGGEAWNSLVDSMKCYQKSLEIQPTFALSWFHLALVEEKLGKHKEAMSSYERFLAVRPGPDLQPQTIYARKRLSERTMAAVPPAGDLSTDPQTWLERLAHGDAKDAETFIRMSNDLKTSPDSGTWIDTYGKKKGGSLFFIPFEVILLLLSLPVLVPSLILNFLMAKRWGRVDFYLLAIDGFIILLFALRSTAATIIVLTAIAASAVLFILRYRKLPYGIFLGYSNTVALLLMGGGLIFVIGFWQFVPWTPLNELTSALGSEKSVTARDLVQRRMEYNSFVSLRNETLEWDKKLFRIIDENGYRFSPFKTEGGIVITKPMDLWERRTELVGRMVTLQGASLSPQALEGTELEYSMAENGTKEKDFSKRLFYTVPEAQGRVWIVSKPDELQVSASPSGDSYQGVLVITYSNASMGRWYQSRFTAYLPYMGVTLLPERSAPVESKKPLRLETWVPVKGTDRTLWLVYMGDATATPPSSMKGVYKANMGAVNGLKEAVSDLAYFQGPLQQPLVIMAAPSKYQYIKENDIAGTFLRGIRWNALAMLIPGILVISVALYLSSKE